jgi:hypothetical protein
MEALSERDRRMLDFEREAWMLVRPKDVEIRERFGISPSSYYKSLSVLVERRAAFDYDPLTVLRLRRQRELRRRQRHEGAGSGPGRRSPGGSGQAFGKPRSR